ncbi:S1 family peptidase [Solirubrobacter taibaiensis]|nr:S1 family peptidase [Solirubrobacter taibaiensis]
MKLISFVSTAAVLMFTASAAQAADLSTTEAQKLESSLGAQGAGVYVDGGETVVNVTSETAAEQVEAAGATAKIVEHSDAELARVDQTIKVTGNVPGMSWAVDPVENKVVVTLDPTVDAAEQAHVEAALASAGDAARIEHTDEAFKPLVAGGEAIYTANSRCSLGFNVRNSANQNFFLTAGHCTNVGVSWMGPNRALIGSRVGTSFPGNDYGLVQYVAGAAAPTGDVSLYNGSRQDIVTARNAIVGERVSRSGSTTGLRSGNVQQVNASVTYAQGTVTGLIRTNVCAQPGDSGGPLFSGTAALGLTSGGSGNCTTGGTTFYQPVTEALSVYGMRVW